jgi:hypothetical protein
MRIHHNTTKRAVKAGIVLTVEGDMVHATHDGRSLARDADPKKALETAIRELNGGALPSQRKPRTAKPRKSSAPASVISDEDSDESMDDEGDLDSERGLNVDEEGDEEAEKEQASVVKPKYRKKYRPHRHTCGDSLTKDIAEEFMEVVEGSKKPQLDFVRFVKFAKANDCWVGSYASLNHGMARMNVANRLRAKVRKDPKFKINWNV